MLNLIYKFNNKLYNCYQLRRVNVRKANRFQFDFVPHVSNLGKYHWVFRKFDYQKRLKCKLSN